MALRTTMRALAITAYATPNKYILAELPVPAIEGSDGVLIKVHAASINPVDVKKAVGMMKIMKSETFPCKIGYDLSGTVLEVGSAVTKFKAGDAVYAKLPEKDQGSVAEYAATTSALVAPKPPSLTHTQAASLPLVALTALQAFDKAEKSIRGGLRGKTVFVPAGLSGTGSIALQLAKNVFGADKVITTVSTAKVSQVDKFLGTGVADQIVDYKTQDVLAEIPKGSVDFMFDTMGGTLSYVSVMRPQTGLIISVSTLPSGTQVEKAIGPLPFWLRYMLNGADWYYRFRIGRWHVNYDYHSMIPDVVDLERISEWVDEGKLLPVVGRVTKFSDLEGIRAGCDEIYKAKGGIGKFVIEMV